MHDHEYTPSLRPARVACVLNPSLCFSPQFLSMSCIAPPMLSCFCGGCPSYIRGFLNNDNVVHARYRQADFLQQHLGPVMRRDHPDVKIMPFDHNRDHREYFTFFLFQFLLLRMCIMHNLSLTLVVALFSLSLCVS